jgi:hypothetical protein
MTASGGTVGDGSFGRMAAIAAMVSLPLAAGNLLAMLAAVGFDLNALSHPLVLLHQGATGATLWHWAMVLDILGYYLLIVPLILALRSWLRAKSPNWIDLSALCLLAYCGIGAIGGAILATAIPPLIRGYATAGAHRVVVETVFTGYSDAVYRGMWNLLEELLAGIGWIAMGVVLRFEDRRLGRATTVLGLACLVDALGTAINVDAVATAGLSVYLVLAPIWAWWVGTWLLRTRPPFVAGRRSRAVGGDTTHAQAATDVGPPPGRRP